jgi:hypothetical protein
MNLNIFFLLCIFSANVLACSLTSQEYARLKEDHTVVASWNICVDFFDEKGHPWSERRSSCLKTLHEINADIYAIQELSIVQATELADFCRYSGYNACFLSQTPSELTVGEIVDQDTIFSTGAGGWNEKIIDSKSNQERLKFCGTPIIGILFKSDKYQMGQVDRFWLNPEPEALPICKDRSITDKGFGNMNTYRAVLWAKLIDKKTQKPLFVFNSHYPLSGYNYTRTECAKIEK